MANRKERLASLLLTILLGGANLAAVNYLVSDWPTARVDLTSEGLFSISPATERLLRGLEEDVTIYGYFSERTHPKLAPLVPEIRDLLAEYRAVSGGRVHFEILDPGQDEEVEQEAADRFGVRSTPFRLASKYESAIVNAYFAVVVRYADQYVRYGFEDLIEIEPTPEGDVEVRLRNLEYDLTRAIKKIVYEFRSTTELFERVEEPVTLTAIWTPDTLPELFAEVPEAVREAAAELEDDGGDRFAFEEIDPTQSPGLEQPLYDRYGARPMALGLFDEGEFYLYAIVEAGDRIEQVPLTGEDVSVASVREAVEDALRRSTPGFIKTVGIVTPDPPDIPEAIRMQMQLPPQPPPEFDEVERLLGQDYRVRDVDLGAADGVPSEVDILLVLKPTDLGTDEVYALDQYLMRGGRVIVCAANYDVDFDSSGLRLVPLENGLDEWLAHHGVTVEETLVLDDRNQPLPIPQVRQTPFGPIRTWTLEPYPYLVQVRQDGFVNPEITASLDAVGMYWASPLTVDPERTSDLDVRRLIESSDVSWTDDDLSRVAFVDYEVPQEGTGRSLLGVALTGRFTSFFSEGPPASGDEGEGEEEDPRVTLERSPETRLVVIGNAQFLSDFVARALSRSEAGFFTENLRFAQNLIDWSSLDNEMLQIRARGLVSRRLDPVERRTEIAIEAVSYLVPVLILGVAGAWLYSRRRRTEPLVPAGSPNPTATSRSEARR